MDLNSYIPIKTPRLLFDAFYPEDWKSYYAIEQTPEDHRFNSEELNPRNEEEIKELVSQQSKQDYNDNTPRKVFAIRHNHEMIGFFGLKNGQLKENGQIEVFYSIHKDSWNNGFGTEALKGMIAFCFDTVKLHRIFAGCDIDNSASKRIMEKAGMRFESRWRKDRLRKSKWTDGLGFSILEEDYFQIKDNSYL